MIEDINVVIWISHMCRIKKLLCSNLPELQPRTASGMPPTLADQYQHPFQLIIHQDGASDSPSKQNKQNGNEIKIKLMFIIDGNSIK